MHTPAVEDLTANAAWTVIYADDPVTFIARKIQRLMGDNHSGESLCAVGYLNFGR